MKMTLKHLKRLWTRNHSSVFMGWKQSKNLSILLRIWYTAWCPNQTEKWQGPVWVNYQCAWYNLLIIYWQSEPLYQDQNLVKRSLQSVKMIANTVINHMVSSPFTWFLALHYICFVCNHATSTTLKNCTPSKDLLPGISALLRSWWWTTLYHANENASFGSE